MKKFAIIFAIVYTINASASALSEAEYKDLAENLANRVRATSTFINDIKTDATRTKDRLDQLKESADFNVPRNPKTIEADSNLDSHKHNRNIINCINLKKTNEEKLIQELRQTLYNKVNSQLHMVEVAVKHIEPVVIDFGEHLKEGNVEHEIQLCMQNEEKCELTTNYKPSLDRYDHMLQLLTTTVVEIIDATLEKEIYPTVTNKIVSEILGPVNECLSNI